jgi:hypothetical protein
MLCTFFFTIIRSLRVQANYGYAASYLQSPYIPSQYTAAYQSYMLPPTAPLDDGAASIPAATQSAATATKYQLVSPPTSG